MGFISASSRGPIRPRVVSLSGHITHTKSAVRNSVSRSTSSAFRARACAAETFGSHAMWRIPNGAASRNTSAPMLPIPIAPSVRPVTPMPM